ncbi:hypothetical protein QDY72_05115 [Kingella negevensis]|nr:hypothetical protein [Kingella negevensis]MDK4679969.1 hypothetical protein [Kingella negevensis]MDK4682312.1 hypothetical protein [Kingella negevensis]MDK4684564.1 hypothetical protein [Kingella negevensis]MDK4690509.1 hypothetical protein [Kingella negevensis]WII92307.1 hypothetical protein QEO94_06535 [Kingella negevensis]
MNKLYIGNSKEWNVFFENLLDFARTDSTYQDLFKDYNDCTLEEALNNLPDILEVKGCLPKSFEDLYNSQMLPIFITLKLSNKQASNIVVKTSNNVEKIKNIINDIKIQSLIDSPSKLGKNKFFYKYDKDIKKGRVLNNLADVIGTDLEQLLMNSNVIKTSYEFHDIFILPGYESNFVQQETWLMDSGADFLRFRDFAELVIWQSLMAITGKIEDEYETLTVDDLKNFGADKILSIEVLDFTCGRNHSSIYGNR